MEPEIHYHAHNSLPFDSVLSQLHSVYALTAHVYILIFPLTCTSASEAVFPPGSPTETAHGFLIFCMRVTRLAHPMLT
jgi:hypothetical protein